MIFVDRVLSAAWLKKFADENSGDEKLRTTYLKLLLFCLQRRSLSGIFADDPSNYEVLEELPQDIDVNYAFFLTDYLITLCSLNS